MKQYQVPQFIDVEDRILGPITMRQFFIMLIPLGVGIVLYFLLKFWLVVIIIIPVIGACALFAFYKPYGMSFSRFFAAFLTFSLKPKMYIWQHEEEAKVVLTQEETQSQSTMLGQIPGGAKQSWQSSGGLKSKKSSVETGSMYRET